MGKYASTKLGLSDAQKDAIIEQLVKIASSVDNTGMKKEASARISDAEKEALVTRLFNDPTGRGLKRIAYLA